MMCMYIYIYIEMYDYLCGLHSDHSRVQELTNTVHPPGGATALLFVIVPVLHKFKFAYAPWCKTGKPKP